MPTVMPRGSVLLYLGSLYHAGGENKTENEVRLAMALFLIRPYLRQEENQYLAVPYEMMVQHSEKVQRLMGWCISHPYCGRYEGHDPILLLRGENTQRGLYKIPVEG